MLFLLQPAQAAATTAAIKAINSNPEWQYQTFLFAYYCLKSISKIFIKNFMYNKLNNFDIPLP